MMESSLDSAAVMRRSSLSRGARRVSDDEGEATYGDGEAGDENCSLQGSLPGEEFDHPGIIGGEGS